jgi:hypothetical protein
VISKNAEGQDGAVDDVHYRCYHGNRKVLTITKAMKGSLNGALCLVYLYSINHSILGLTGHLKNHFLPMYRLFTVLKNRKEPPTEEEILIASGKKVLDPATATDYLRQLENASNTIVDVFNHQIQKAAVRSGSFPICYSSDLHI